MSVTGRMISQCFWIQIIFDQRLSVCRNVGIEWRQGRGKEGGPPSRERGEGLLQLSGEVSSPASGCTFRCHIKPWVASLWGEWHPLGPRSRRTHLCSSCSQSRCGISGPPCSWSPDIPRYLETLLRGVRCGLAYMPGFLAECSFKGRRFLF